MRSSTRGILYILLCSLLWSTGGLFIKLLPWHPMVIAAMRSFLAAIVLYVDMRFIAKTPRIRINRQTMTIGFFLGMTMLQFVIANKLTTAANAIVLQSTSTIFVILYSTFILKKRPPLYEKVVTVAGLSGITLFFFDRLSPAGLLGNFVALGSAVTFAGTFLSSGAAKDAQTANSGLILGQAVSVIAGAPFLLIFPPEVAPTAVGAILFLGLFQVGLAYTLFSRGTQLCPPVKASIGSMLEPVCSPIWVALFMHEIPGPPAILGGVLVIGALTVWGVLNAREGQKEAALQ